MIQIPLTNSSSFAIIDDEDSDKVSKFKWSWQAYAIRSSDKIFKGRRILLHRFILGMLERGPLAVAHINSNMLDNRKSNLKIYNLVENSMYTRKAPDTSSKYMNVYFAKRDKVWRAQIRYNGKRYSLGSFSSESDAAIAINSFNEKHNP